MTFIYTVIKYVTFPGAYIRCFFEQILLRITKTPVEDSRYIRDDEMSGHIEHELIKSPCSALFTALIPCLINICGAAFLAVCSLFFSPSSVAGRIFSGLSLWFAVSLLSNCFPTVEDALNMAHRIYKEGNIFEKILFSPFFAVLFVGAYLEKYSLTFAVSFAMALMLIF